MGRAALMAGGAGGCWRGHACGTWVLAPGSGPRLCACGCWPKRACQPAGRLQARHDTAQLARGLTCRAPSTVARAAAAAAAAAGSSFAESTKYGVSGLLTACGWGGAAQRGRSEGGGGAATGGDRRRGRRRRPASPRRAPPGPGRPQRQAGRPARGWGTWRGRAGWVCLGGCCGGGCGGCGAPRAPGQVMGMGRMRVRGRRESFEGWKWAHAGGG